MDTTIFLTKAFAIYFVIMSIVMLIRRKAFQEAFIQLASNRGSVLLISIVTLILGIVLVLFHPAGSGRVGIVIAVLCWLTLIKGIVNLLFPEKMLIMSQKLLLNSAFYYIAGSIMLLFGLWLGWCGGFWI